MDEMDKGSNVTWGGRFSTAPSALMQTFGESVSFDSRLASFDIQGSRAHATMLQEVGILSEEELASILHGLDVILRQIESGAFEWDPALEDVHMNIEQALTSICPAAAKLHTARSRNDQVATDMRLWHRWACDVLCDELKEVIGALVALADRSRDVYIPGYTHLQRAQPVSMAHHLLAYCEMFGRDLDRFGGLKERYNILPLGSGAVAGTTLPVDRESVALQLGFVGADGLPRLTRNSMDAVSDRDAMIELAAACALVGVHFSRISEDFILWNSSEFGFVRLPDTFTTGSSLMPQKKNPDSFELLRGKAARLQGNLQTLLTLCKGLPLTYNRDLQEDKPPVFDSFDQTRLALAVLAASLEGVEPVRDRCAAAVGDPALLATDLVDELVLKGLPFREAHHVIGRMVGLAEARGCRLDDLSDADVVEIHPLMAFDWRSVFDVQRALARRERPGMPGPAQVLGEIQRWRFRLQ